MISISEVWDNLLWLFSVKGFSSVTTLLHWGHTNLPVSYTHLAIAKAYKLDMPDLTVTRTTVEDTEAEIALYNKSVAAVKLEKMCIRDRY